VVGSIVYYSIRCQGTALAATAGSTKFTQPPGFNSQYGLGEGQCVVSNNGGAVGFGVGANTPGFIWPCTTTSANDITISGWYFWK
jgi:hypothetical protein